MKQELIYIIGILIIAGSIIYGVVAYSGLKTKEINNQARFECAQSSRYTITQQDGSIVWYPVEDLYKKCLTEKNIK
jgi:hypothetical protein